MATLEIFEKGTQLRRINRGLVTFLAIAVLFLGSLAYLVNTAMKDKETLEKRQDARGLYYQDLGL